MHDNVSVIGAGTSGLIAARDLAAAGIATRVYDQKSRLGYPPKASGIISINGLESLGIGYRKAVTNELFGANIHAGGAVMKVMSRKPQAHVLDREKLNLVCYEEAVSAGAKAELGTKINDDMLEELHRSSVLVGADGPLSAVAKHFSMGSIERYTLTYKAEYNVSVEDPRAVDLYFDNSLAPKFFAWACPNSKDVLEIGIGIDGRHGNSKAAFEKFVRMKDIAGRIAGAKMLDGYASLIPMQTVRKVVDAKNEVVLVGDAAGQVKPTTGGGIVFGGNAARMAAKAIAGYINRGDGLGTYEKLFRKNFGLDIKLHSFLNMIYSSFDERKLGFMINAAKTLGFESFFANYGDMDRPSVMLKRFFLRGLAK